MQPLAVTVPEAARLLGISERHCYTLIEAGVIPARDLAVKGTRRCLRISVAWLERWVGPWSESPHTPA